MPKSRRDTLQNRSAAILAEMKAVRDAAEKAGRDELTAEETATFDSLEKEAGTVDAQLAIENRIAEREKALAKVPAALPVDDDEPEKLTEVHPAIIRARSLPRRHSRLKVFLGADGPDLAYGFGMWFLASQLGNRNAEKWCNKNGVDLLTASTGHSTDVNTAGGFLVPPEFSASIIDLREQRGVFRRNVHKESMASDSKTVPRRTSGVTAYWMKENNDVTVSQKGWDQVELTARKLGAMCRYSSEITEDAIINIADDLAKEIAYAFADKEDLAGFLGDGTSTYGGIVGLHTRLVAATASLFTSATGNTAFATLDLEDFEGVSGLLPQYAEMGAKWYCSKQAWANSMARLQMAAGGNTGGNIAAGGTKEFLGSPVEISQVLNSTLTAQTGVTAIYYGNLELAATMGTRRDLTIKTTMDRYFEFDQLAILGTERVDIVVHDVGDTSVAGPMVGLKFAAS